MATRGRKPLPNAIKELQGTLRKCRIMDGAIAPTQGDIQPPNSLPEGARKYFVEYADMLRSLRISSPAFIPVVVELAMRMQEIETLTADLEKNGFVLEYKDKDDPNKILRKANPAFAMRSDALRHLGNLLAECGLTPSAATRVKKLNNDEDKKPTGFAALD